jgi:hypothetical protein
MIRFLGYTRISYKNLARLIYRTAWNIVMIADTIPGCINTKDTLIPIFLHGATFLCVSTCQEIMTLKNETGYPVLLDHLNRLAHDLIRTRPSDRLQREIFLNDNIAHFVKNRLIEEVREFYWDRNNDRFNISLDMFYLSLMQFNDDWDMPQAQKENYQTLANEEINSFFVRLRKVW